MNLDHLRYFAAIAQLQHYGKAAEQLHVSQPNLNYAVSQLETELGVPLFEKSGRNVRLTRYGKEFLPSVQRTLETLDAGTRSIRELGQNGGLVLLGSIRKLGTSLVPELMRDFRQQEEPAAGRDLPHRPGPRPHGLPQPAARHPSARGLPPLLRVLLPEAGRTGSVILQQSPRTPAGFGRRIRGLCAFFYSPQTNGL